MTIAELVGKTLISAKNEENTEIVFTVNNGDVYALCHERDCCESVFVEDVCGDLEDLVGAPIVRAEEVANIEGFDARPLEEGEESYTWTFYRLATIKGSVTIRFYGTSNGYYSESVDLQKRRKG